MKNVVTMVALLVLVCSALSVAQTAGGWSVGVGAEGGVPIGDFSNVSSFGIGGTAWAGYNVDPSFLLAVKSGYLVFSVKDALKPANVSASVKIIPIVLEGKYFFMPTGDTRVYGAADAGLYLLDIGASASVGGVSVSVSTTTSKFGFAPTLGAQFKVGDKMYVDAHGNYTYIATDGGSTSYIGFGLGLAFDLQ